MEKSPSILLVEDDEHDVVLARRALRGPELRDPDVARVDRLGALAGPLGTGQPDLILLDLTLPDSTGLDTLSHVRNLFEDTPIVVLTSIDDERLGIEALRAGAEDYVRKGTEDMVRLARTARYAFERHQFRRRAPETEVYRAASGLPGRTIFVDRFTMALRRADHEGTTPWVVLVRCDAISAVAQQYGSKTANVFQRALIRRLNHRLELTDSVADLGADEFGILIESSLVQTRPDELLRGLGRTFTERLTISGPSDLLDIEPQRVLIGHAQYPGDGRTVPLLLGKARARMAPSKGGA